MHQYHKYGRFLDNIQRTNQDLNDYTIDRIAQTATFNLYNQKNQHIGQFVIDLADIEKVKYHKWRLCHGHVITGLPARKTDRSVAHVILCHNARQSNLVVDHIDGDPMNNRRSNLRLITQSENTKNQCMSKRNSTGFKGISFDKDRSQWASEIHYEYKRIHFARRTDKREAVYQRMIAEMHLYKDLARQSEIKRMQDFTDTIDAERKKELYDHVKTKLEKHNLWQ